MWRYTGTVTLEGMCDHCGCHDFAPIGELADEHETIQALGWTVANAVHHGEPVDEAARDALLTLLDAHARKEETGLYPQLRAQGDLADDVSERLEDEHREVLVTIAAGRFGRKAYYELAAHIEEEEMELFPAAMFAFEDEDWHRMSHAHQAVAG